MFRISFFPVALFSLTLAACADDAAELQRAADKAQAEADQKIGAAASEADREQRAAQAEADTKIAAVRADFTVLREDYRHSSALALADLDKKVATLEARALASDGNAKAELETRLAVIRAQREAFLADYRSLDTETALTWDATKVRLDKAWAELVSRVDAA